MAWKKTYDSTDGIVWRSGSKVLTMLKLDDKKWHVYKGREMRMFVRSLFKGTKSEARKFAERWMKKNG